MKPHFWSRLPILLIVALGAAFLFAACGSDEPSAPAPAAPEAQPAAPAAETAAAAPAAEAAAEPAAEPVAEPAAAGGETLKVGYGGALLGNLATYGLSDLYGLEFAVEQVNAAGGVLGRQIEIVPEDDGCDPALASTASEKLLSRGLKLIFGHTCSGATRSALSVYGNNALVISSSATDVSLTDDGAHPYFFRTTPRDDAQSKLQVELVRNKGFKKIAVLHDKGDYGFSVAELFKGFIEADSSLDVEIVLFEGVTSGEVSYDEIVSLIRSKQAEAVVWGGLYNDASKLAIQMRDKGVEAVVIGADGLYDQRFITMGGKAVEGSYATGQMDFSNSEAGKAALADHAKRHREETGTYFFYAAGAAQALFAAIEKTGSVDDFDALRKSLTENTVETVMGPVRFDAKGDIIGAGFKLYQIENGGFKEVIF
ncbi:MAG: branched-chain amino acid ABC transporter substrate-binding protein [Deltaproteobacteria bacterium]|jgi:branched-chain amino acid transport system substrate-binding protein|nr:branched-chain amino acid ABC transporter substrate-binding protein [Deltaproteobacteria bacterium]